jgi:hypothetical protein
MTVNLVSFLLLVGMTIYIVGNNFKVAQKALENKVNKLAEFSGRAAGKLVWDFDIPNLQKLAEDLAQDDDIEAVHVFDKDGKALTTMDMPKRTDLSLIKVNIPSPKGSESIGLVEVRFSIDSVKKTTMDNAISFIIASILFQFILSFVVYFFIKRLSHRLEAEVDRLRETAEQALLSSHTLKDVSDQFSEKSTTQAAVVEETSANLSEVTSIAKVNSESAQKASSEAQKTFVAAQSGYKEINSLIAAMSEISTSARKIQEITNVVDDIAFQTNLLALNAAVEAARAGEQGKGFAVVADAVRSLAQKSAEAAKGISSMISESVDKIENGSKLVERSSQALNDIIIAIERVRAINSEIATSSLEQAQGIEGISKAMEELDAVTNKTVEASGHASEQAVKLSNQSENLQDVILTLEREIMGSVKRKMAA